MLRVTIRVVKLHSMHGDTSKRSAFSAEMVNHSWRGVKRTPKRNEAIIMPGDRINWGTVIMAEYIQVEQLLNRVGVS